VYFSFLVNGTPTGFFSSSYDLRQGDSPLMFVIVMKALGRMIFVVAIGDLLSGFFVGIGNVGGFAISQLLFADDTLIFRGANPDHLRHLRCLFLCLKLSRA
jgi:hypothetical protein